MSAPLEHQTVESLREHWLNLYQLTQKRRVPIAENMPWRLAAIGELALTNLICVLRFTAGSQDEALQLFREHGGEQAFAVWDKDHDNIVSEVEQGNVDSQYLTNMADLVIFVKILWLVRNYDMATKYLEWAWEWSEGGRGACGRHFQYSYDSIHVMWNFSHKQPFTIPEPRKGYSREENCRTAYFRLMQAVVERANIEEVIVDVDVAFKAANKGKRMPKSFSFDDDESRLKAPWDWEKYAILQYARDHYVLDAPN